jgi:transposase
MAKNLSPQEIEQRLIKLRNYERLYPELKEKYEKAKKKIKEQEARINTLSDQLETALLRIEELERMVFGDGPKRGDEPDSFVNSQLKKKSGKHRDQTSYRRQVPDRVDDEVFCPIDACPDCRGPLSQKQTHAQYTEDIILPSLEGDRTTHVLKELIEKGYCPSCKKWKRAKKIQPQQVMLGEKVKTLICFSTYVLNLSVSQVKSLLAGLYQFPVSNGEITYILSKSGQKLSPEYEAIKERIRGQPGNHYDETGWLQGKERSFGWVMTGNRSPEAVFEVGQTRGKGVAEKLKADSGAIGITDCYPAYKNLFEIHQICWAHLARTARDLKNSETLSKSKSKKKRCESVYSQVCEVYKQLLEFCEGEFDLEKGKTLKEKLNEKINRLAQIKTNDPKKLQNLLERIKDYKDCLFICLEHPNIPPDNNKAERTIRHLVLKRKNSFGTKTKKGSRTFSINMSVSMSQWWTSPNAWFTNMHQLLNA